MFFITLLHFYICVHALYFIAVNKYDYSGPSDLFGDVGGFLCFLVIESHGPSRFLSKAEIVVNIYYNVNNNILF